MTNHDELELLSAYLDGEIDASERERLERHIPGCAECTTTLAALKATLADLSLLDFPELDAETIAAIDQRVAAARSVRRSAARRIGWISGAAAAGIVALVAVLATVHPGRNAATQSGNALGAGAGTVADSTETNYTEEALAQALAAYGENGAYFSADYAASPKEAAAPVAGGGTTQDRSSPLHARALEAAADSGIAKCAAAIEKSDPDVKGVRFEIARFKGADAYVLFYERPRENPTSVEVWVVRPADCQTLYFAQRRL